MHRNDGRPGIVGRGEPTGANGEFRLVGMRKGRFSISAGGSELTDALAIGAGIGPGGNPYSDPVSIEIIEADVIGIELKVRRGGSVSGGVVIEGNNDAAVQAQLSRIRLIGLINTTDGSPQTPLVTQTVIGPGNLFRFDGIRPGKFHISAQINRLSRGKLTLARIERNGALQPDGIDVGPGEQVGGVRLVFVFGN